MTSPGSGAKNGDEPPVPLSYFDQLAAAHASRERRFIEVDDAPGSTAPDSSATRAYPDIDFSERISCEEPARDDARARARTVVHAYTADEIAACAPGQDPASQRSPPSMSMAARVATRAPSRPPPSSHTPASRRFGSRAPSRPPPSIEPPSSRRLDPRVTTDAPPVSHRPGRGHWTGEPPSAGAPVSDRPTSPSELPPSNRGPVSLRSFPIPPARTPALPVRGTSRPRPGALGVTTSRVATGVPRLALTPAELVGLPLGHHEGFVLAQIDGSSSIEDILDVSAFGRDETLEILEQLVQKGVVKVGR